MNEKEKNTITTDIAVIKNEMKNISASFEDFKKTYTKYCDKLETVENKQIATSEKVSNLAIFQSVFSIIIGAIATYLGVNRQ